MNNNVSHPNERLLNILDLIENEDVDSLKSLLSTWKISSKLGSFKSNENSIIEQGMKSQNDCGNSNSSLENTVKNQSFADNNAEIQKSNKSSELEDRKSSTNNSDHECHPLCSCNEERLLAKSPSFMPQNTFIDSPSISVILHSRDDMGRTALHIASLVGNPLTVEVLISHNDVSTSGLYRPTNCINCKDAFGMTPIHYASMKGHQNILLLLLHADADQNALDNENNTPLHVAANHGQESCVKALIYYAEHQSCSLDLNAQNLSENTPLHLAAKWGFSKIVDILLSYDAR